MFKDIRRSLHIYCTCKPMHVQCRFNPGQDLLGSNSSQHVVNLPHILTCCFNMFRSPLLPCIEGRPVAFRLWCNTASQEATGNAQFSFGQTVTETLQRNGRVAGRHGHRPDRNLMASSCKQLARTMFWGRSPKVRLRLVLLCSRFCCGLKALIFVD